MIRKPRLAEALEIRNLLTSVFPQPEAFGRGSADLVYRSAIDELLVEDAVAEATIELRSGQLLSFGIQSTIPQNAAGIVQPLSANVSVLGPSGAITARSVQVADDRAEVSVIGAVPDDGVYTLNLQWNDDNLADAVSIEAFVNRLYESEIGASNDSRETAESLDDRFTRVLSTTTDEITNVFGRLNDPLSTSYSNEFSEPLDQRWTTTVSHSTGSVGITAAGRLELSASGPDPNGPMMVEHDVEIDYDPQTGDLSATAVGPAFTTLQITSDVPIFSGESEVLTGVFDLLQPQKVFILNPTGLTNVQFGPIVQPGLSPQELNSMLSFTGSRLEGGPVIVVPAWELREEGYVGLEAIVEVDVSKLASPVLKFDYGTRGHRIAELPVPSKFAGSVVGRGVSVSVDGQHWQLVKRLDDCRLQVCQESIELDEHLGPNFDTMHQQLWVKFQYATLGSESVWIDNVSLSGFDSDFYSLTLSEGEQAFVDISSERLPRTPAMRIYDEAGQLMTSVSHIPYYAAGAQIRFANPSENVLGPQTYFIEILGRHDYRLSVRRSDTIALGQQIDRRSSLNNDGVGRFLVEGYRENIQFEYERLRFNQNATLTMQAWVPDIAFSNDSSLPSLGFAQESAIGELTAAARSDMTTWVSHDSKYVIIDLAFTGLEEREFDSGAGAGDQPDYEVDFWYPYTTVMDFRTFDLANVQWSGPAIHTVELEPAGAKLKFKEAVPAGEYSLRVDGLRDLLGQPIPTIDTVADLQPPSLNSVSIQDGDVLPTGNTGLVLSFDETIRTYGYGWKSFLTLAGPTGSTEIEVPDNSGSFLAFELGQLRPGSYELQFDDFVVSDMASNESEIKERTVSFEVVAAQPGRNTASNFDMDGNGLVDAHDLSLLEILSRQNRSNSAFDLTGDGLVDNADIELFAREALQSRHGDANLDGVFDSSDLVAIMKSDTAHDRDWQTGDFNGDGMFDSQDWVLAFKASEYRG